MKKHPVMKEDSGGQAKWKWVIVVAVVLTLAAGAWLFAMPKKQPPVQAKAPVRAKIQAAAIPVAGTAPETSAPTQADAAEQALEEDEETGETSVLTEADEETPDVLSAGSADGVQTTAQEPPVAAAPAADKETESKPAPTAVPMAAPNTSVQAPKPMLATTPDQTAKPLPPVREETPAPPPAPSVAAPAPEKKAPVAAQQVPYTIQVGAFRNKSNADGMFKVLRGLGYNPFIFKLDSEGKDPLYMVRFGGFADRDDATAALNAFKQKENMAAVGARSGQI
jgi:cell division septation protein DedD